MSLFTDIEFPLKRYQSSRWVSCDGQELAALKANYQHKTMNKLYESYETQGSLLDNSKKNSVIDEETSDDR